MLAGLWALGFALVAGPAGAGPAGAGPAAVRIDGVVARVEGVPIFRSELAARVRTRLIERKAAGPPTPAELRQIEGDELAAMIDDLLVRLDAARLGFESTEGELAAMIAMVKQMYGLDATQLEAAVRDWGLSFADYEEQLRRQIVAQKWLNYYAGAIDMYLFADDGGVNAAYAAERRRRIEELRARAFIEVSA